MWLLFFERSQSSRILLKLKRNFRLLLSKNLSANCGSKFTEIQKAFCEACWKRMEKVAVNEEWLRYVVLSMLYCASYVPCNIRASDRFSKTCLRYTVLFEIRGMKWSCYNAIKTNFHCRTCARRTVTCLYSSITVHWLWYTLKIRPNDLYGSTNGVIYQSISDRSIDHFANYQLQCKVKQRSANSSTTKQKGPLGLKYLDHIAAEILDKPTTWRSFAASSRGCTVCCVCIMRAGSQNPMVLITVKLHAHPVRRTQCPVPKSKSRLLIVWMYIARNDLWVMSSPHLGTWSGQCAYVRLPLWGSQVCVCVCVCACVCVCVALSVAIRSLRRKWSA